MKHKQLTHDIINAAHTVHNTLGFGFLENVYQNALLLELLERGIEAEAEKPIKVIYHRQVVGDYVADIVVERKVIAEVKAVKKLHEIHEVQLVNYLKATGLEVGLLINFGLSVEVRRKINDAS